MKNAQPLLNPTTHYRIELQGQVDLEWLQDFDSSVEVVVDETEHMEVITALNVHTDQSGIVGLVRRLHGLGVVLVSIRLMP